MDKDPYKILGVSKNSTQEDIKKAFRSGAIKYHPDKGGDEEKFKELGSAMDLIGTKEKREQYDRYGHDQKGQGREPMSMDDIFSHFGDRGFNDIFGHRSQHHNLNKNKGTNLRIKVSVTLKDILVGCQKKIKLNKFVKCNICSGNGGTNEITCLNCNGRGHLINIKNTIMGQIRQTITCFTCDGMGQIIKNKCKDCSGEGIIKKEEYFSFEIPKGVEDGMQLNISGYGNIGRRNGSPGDLLIIIEEIEDSYLIRDRNNILYDLNINMINACLGTEIEVPTILNNVKITIKPGTQSGELLRLKGKGLPDINYGQLGDQLIKINIIIPKELTSEEKELLEKLKLSKNFIS